MDEELSILKEEIETYNSGLKLLKKPIWISSEENRQKKKHASIIIAVENAEQAQIALEKRLCIAGNWLIAEKCKQNSQQIQCQNCQRFGHATRACFAQSNCQICAEQHKTFEHKCNICNIQGKTCSHSAIKCKNCGENHMTNSDICGFKANPAKRHKSSQNQSKNSSKTILFVF